MTWTAIEGRLKDIAVAMDAARSPDDFKSVGMRSREFLIFLARTAFDASRHLQGDDPSPGASDAKAMLDAFFKSELKGGEHEEARRLVRSAVQFAHAVTHKENADRQSAAVAFAAAEAVARIAAAAAGQSFGFRASGWVGVEVGSRYFAWDGPRLHALEDRLAVPTPPALLEELKRIRMKASFGSKRSLRQYLEKGQLQVFETDRASWRKALLHDGDDLILIVRAANEGETL